MEPRSVRIPHCLGVGEFNLISGFIEIVLKDGIINWESKLLGGNSFSVIVTTIARRRTNNHKEIGDKHELNIY